MKNIIKILVFFLLANNLKAQIVNIPDANFKARLLAANSTTQQIAKDISGNYITIDQNLDGEIQQSEALLVYALSNLNFSSQFPINDMTGIKSFENLTDLNCSFGNHSSLDVSNMINLTNLSCFNSNINSLNVSGCLNLVQLTCENSQLTSLDLNGLSNLVYVFANNNQIQNINLSGTTSLTTLQIGNNLLTSLDVTSSINLTDLYATLNQITSVNLTGLSSLKNAFLNYNQLTSLDVSTLSSLEILQCSFNNLTTIDISNCHNFISLGCTDNNLITLFMKFGNPSLLINNFPLNNNPNLQYVCMDSYRILNFTQYFNSIGMSNVVINSYCSFTPGGNYNTITGTIQFDSNGNGCDSNDLVFPNIRMNMTQWGINSATFSNINGNYTFYTTFADQLIEPSVENPSWFNFTPESASISFPNNNNNTYTQDFCITANGVHPDVEVVIMPVSAARPGFDATYKIVYKNKGNQTLLGNVMLTFDNDRTDFVSSNPNPDNLGVNSLSWNYTNLLPFENRVVNLTLNVNSPVETPAVNIGDVLIFTTTINPISGDELPIDNTFTYNQTVVGAFDPNNIECLEGEVVNPSYIGQYLHYAVNFENTGNFPAENVVVKIEIDTTKYNINSLQLLNTSHNSYTKITGNVVEFIFENIALDSGGHGNVLFKIQTMNSLINGDAVAKRGDIYFDYNAPIDTGMATTTFEVLNNTVFEQDNSIVVYPNPTNSIISIKGNFNIKSIELYDVQGRLLQTQLIDDLQSTIDISEKSNGIYFIKINSDKGSKIEKILKE